MQILSGRAARQAEAEDYDALLAHIRSAAPKDGLLFTTDAANLYEIFLRNLPRGRKQHYECRACRKFVERFGGLATIDDKGAARSAFWDVAHAPAFFAEALHVMALAVRNARVTGVFLTGDPILGDPSNQSSKSPTGTWHHMHANVVPRLCSPFFTPDHVMVRRVMAEKSEDYGTICRALAEFPIDIVRRAHMLLTTGALFRSEKCIGGAQWLLHLHEAREATKNTRMRENLTWRAVATAPPGYCHVRSTMIGTLLQDLMVGKPFDDIKRAFNEKMDPFHYQRPQAAPTDGQLTVAEKLIEKLGSAGALARRYATLTDISADAIWLPKTPAPLASGSVFGHLRAGRSSSTTNVDKPQTITWEKFWRTVLPEAEKIDCYVPRSGPFFAFVTAVDPTAPPILQWDRPNSRNSVSWYLYDASGSYAPSWGLSAGVFTDVTAITLQPSSWGGGGDHHGNGVYLVLKGARDTRPCGLALFPEILKAEYRGIRSAMEAYSLSRRIEPVDTPACGLALQRGADGWDAKLRVLSKGVRVTYKLDRWD